jgi:hypothetical protein
MDQHQFEALKAALDAPKWTEIVTVAVIVLSLLIAVGSLVYARRQLLADHRRSQRQLAMEMCQRWSNFTSAESSSVVRLVEKLDDKQCATIVNLSGPLSVDADNTHLLLNIFLLRFPQCEQKLKSETGQTVAIDGQYLLYLRHIAVRYLNMLESILMTWTMGIADQRVIESEFSFVLDPKQGRSGMENLRTRLGHKSFPAIAMFVEAQREKERRNLSEVERPPEV